MSDDWEAHWERYAAAASINPAQSLRHEAIIAALRTRSWPTAQLLDIGSGQGDFVARAAEAGAAHRYAGFELSESGVRISAAKVPQAEFLRVDVLAPDPVATRFAGWATAAVCSDVVEHLDDPTGFLTAVAGYLAAGATLIVTVPGGPMSQFDRHIGHRRHYDAHALRRVLEAAGFIVERVHGVGFPFFNLYRLIVIARGNRLIADVEQGEAGEAASSLARFVMRCFGFAFRCNLDALPWGWQMVAVARKPPAQGPR
jgi:SAM-dependent methyltransferase